MKELYSQLNCFLTFLQTLALFYVNLNPVMFLLISVQNLDFFICV